MQTMHKLYLEVSSGIQLFPENKTLKITEKVPSVLTFGNTTIPTGDKYPGYVVKFYPMELAIVSGHPI